MIRTLLLLCTFMLGACAATPQRERSTPLQLVDLTGEFAAVHAATEGMDEAARVEALKQHFAVKLPGFYSLERVKSPAYNDRIAQGLKDFPQQRAGIEEVSRRFAAMLAPAQASFEAEFGPMTGYPPIYLVHSLTEFDGGVRSLPEGSRLLFGADMIARLHLQHNIQPFFHHELFHLQHARTFSDCQPIWCSLWKEGLATYVAKRLNPSATDAELLLTFPVSLREAVERDRPRAVCPILAKLDSVDAADYPPIFQGRPQKDAVMPPRYGYYVGYLAAAEAGKGRSLRELARMTKEEARPLVETSLRRLADCTA